MGNTQENEALQNFREKDFDLDQYERFLMPEIWSKWGFDDDFFKKLGSKLNLSSDEDFKKIIQCSSFINVEDSGLNSDQKRAEDMVHQ